MTSVSLLYFASFRERLKLENEMIEIDESIKNIADLKQLLASRKNAWEDVFSADKNVLVSINQNMAKTHSPITHNDEIAFFPPVTGG